MSEQIKQLDAWVKIWAKFEYFNLWNVTIQSLAKNNIIPKKDYGDYNIKRPDWLLVDRSNKKNPRVIAVIEYKSWEKFQKEKDIEEAIKQCNEYAQVLWAVFGVATDTNVSAWINPNEENKENEYVDSLGNTRSYSFIKDEEKQKLSQNFYFHKQKSDQPNEEKLSDEAKETLKIVKRILDSDIWSKNSELKDTIYVDPTNLAVSVWQDIYVATWKEPTKCLYNVVELFIFKFLSDLGVLDDDTNFDKIVNLVSKDEKKALEYYAKNVRPEIRNKFPSDSELWLWTDKTTIINWTIFVENWEAVLANAWLFKKSILKYNGFWDLTNIEKSFKKKLYETFLKRDSWVKWMGQFFTPRKVVWSIVEMAKVESLKSWSRVCDPFCWVWWFPLEVIARRNNKDFSIKNWKITEDIQYFWFDKWNDSDAERTIILAKANMLIYLSDLVKNNDTITKEFSKLFNKTFRLKTGILWTLSDVSDIEEDKYDLIITNPPYVTSWSSILKEEIGKDQDKQDFYKINWMWVEWLAIEWIVNKLKKWWKAFVVVPDGIFNRLNDNKLRKFILDECFLNWITSLPINTFFTTLKKTYILAITKKDNKQQKQTNPVFTYLVSDIWETLDVYRFNTWKSDLEKAKDLFKMFDGNEKIFEKHNNDPRCKIWQIDEFINNINNNWTVDRWWTKEEKIELLMEEQEETLNLEEFLQKVRDTKAKMNEIEENILEITK